LDEPVRKFVAYDIEGSATWRNVLALGREVRDSLDCVPSCVWNVLGEVDGEVDGLNTVSERQQWMEPKNSLDKILENQRILQRDVRAVPRGRRGVRRQQMGICKHQVCPKAARVIAVIDPHSY
jgi:hypothetical protein